MRLLTSTLRFDMGANFYPVIPHERCVIVTRRARFVTVIFSLILLSVGCTTFSGSASNSSLSKGVQGLVITSLQPAIAQVGASGKTLSVIGDNFTNSTVATINGDKRPTTVVNTRLLRVSLASYDTAVPRSMTVSASDSSTGSSSNAVTFTIVTNDAGAGSINMTPLQAAVTAGGTQMFSATVSGITNTGVSWSATGGSIPSSSSSGGSVSYTAPSTPGTYKVVATASGDSTKSVSATVTVTAPSGPSPLRITTSALGNAATGTPYSATLSASGGATPYSWSLASGTLPSGLTLSQSGSISGTANTAGTYSFGIKVTDSTSSATGTFSINVGSNPGGNLSPVVDANADNWSCTSSSDGQSMTLRWNTDVGGSAKVLWGYDDNWGSVTPETDTTYPGATTHTVTLTNLAPGSNIVWEPLAHGFTNGAVDLAKENSPGVAKNCSLNEPPAGTPDYKLTFDGPGVVVAGIPSFFSASGYYTRGQATNIIHTISGQPPCSVVHWDIAEHGWGGELMTKNVSSDSLFLYDLTQAWGRFRLDTNVGCTTPPGNYTLTLSDHTGTSGAAASSWTAPPPSATPVSLAIRVQASGLPAQNPPSSAPAVDANSLSNWETWATKYAGRLCDPTDPTYGLASPGCQQTTNLGQLCVTNYGGSETMWHVYDYDRVHRLTSNPGQWDSCAQKYLPNTQWWLSHSQTYLRNTVLGTLRGMNYPAGSAGGDGATATVRLRPASLAR